MYLVTASEMQEMDRRTIESFGIPGRVLMESAGRGATQFLRETIPDIDRRRVGVLAGRGNNGGDGFVIARYLFSAGIRVTVFLLSVRDRVSGDAAANLELLDQLAAPVVELPDEASFQAARSTLAHQEVWVDAILGTGLNSDVRGYFAAVIDFLNDSGKPVFAVDIPSGLHADTGRPLGVCVRARATATFAHAKIGHALQPGADLSGSLEVIDIGIPPFITEAVGPRQYFLTEADIRAALPSRPPETHKGRTGHLLVVAGSTGKTGAAAMTATSAMRAGAGLVTLAIPASLNSAVEPQVTEAMTLPLPDGGDGFFDGAGLTDLADRYNAVDCLAIGPGIGTQDLTGQFLREVLAGCPLPAVIDADGLNLLAEDPSVLAGRTAPTVLTPHPGEMARLTGTTSAGVQADRVGTARRFATDHGVHLVLKGARTVIAAPDGRVRINPTGNPGMASGGMGDVLTGLIAGFLTQGFAPETACALGVYLHGAAADHLAETRGPFGYLASELMAEIPAQIRRIVEETP